MEDQIVEQLALHEAVSGLTAEQRYVVVGTICVGLTESEVAWCLGLGHRERDRVHTIKETALRRLRRALEAA